jgi:hypothetical protein
MNIYGIECNTKEDVMDQIGQHLSGSCMNSVEQCWEDEEYLKGINAYGITEDDVYDHLATHGIYQCDSCGWWTYEGEGDGIDCDDCANDKASEEPEHDD